MTEQMIKEMTITPEELADRLCDIISEKGLGYLSEQPLSVYDEMLRDKVSPPLARSLLSTILADIHSDAEAKAKQGTKKAAEKGAKKLSQEALAADIRGRCFLNAEIADFLAAVYLSLFSESNLSEWQEHALEGFRELCSEEMEYQYSGDSTWHANGGHVDCSCDVELVYGIQDPDKALMLVGKALDVNPFATAEELCKIIEDELDDVIQNYLDDYVTGDSYYEPYMDDFDCRDAIEEFFKDNGIKLVKYECSTDQSDFESDYDYGRRW